MSGEQDHSHRNPDQGQVVWNEQHLKNLVDQLPDSVASLYQEMYDWRPLWQARRERGMLIHAFIDAYSFHENVQRFEKDDPAIKDLPLLNRVWLASLDHLGGLHGPLPTFLFTLNFLFLPGRDPTEDEGQNEASYRNDSVIYMKLKPSGFKIERDLLGSNGPARPSLQGMREQLRQDDALTTLLGRLMIKSTSQRHAVDVARHCYSEESRFPLWSPQWSSEDVRPIPEEYDPYPDGEFFWVRHLSREANARLISRLLAEGDPLTVALVKLEETLGNLGSRKESRTPSEEHFREALGRMYEEQRDEP